MAFFDSIFNRQSPKINVYTNEVQKPIRFKARNYRQLEALYTSLIEVRIIEDFIGDAISKIPVGVYRGDTEVFNTQLN